MYGPALGCVRAPDRVAAPMGDELLRITALQEVRADHAFQLGQFSRRRQARQRDVVRDRGRRGERLVRAPRGGRARGRSVRITPASSRSLAAAVILPAGFTSPSSIARCANSSATAWATAEANNPFCDVDRPREPRLVGEHDAEQLALARGPPRPVHVDTQPAAAAGAEKRRSQALLSVRDGEPAHGLFVERPRRHDVEQVRRVGPARGRNVEQASGPVWVISVRSLVITGGKYSRKRVVAVAW